MSIDDTTFDERGSYEIRADERTNTLYLSVSGALTEARMTTAARETLTAAESLETGFAIIVDVSTFRPPSPEATKPVEDVQQRLQERDLGEVVRVVGDDTSQVVATAVQRRSREAPYDWTTAATVRAAETRLDI